MKEPEGTLMEFCLYGGRADGAVVVFPLKEAGTIYLVRSKREHEKVWDVLAYQFANRTDGGGRWVLSYVRYVGFQGLNSGEIVKSGESAE